MVVVGVGETCCSSSKGMCCGRGLCCSRVGVVVCVVTGVGVCVVVG